MKILMRLSMAMIAVPLMAMLWSSHWMIPFVQPERHQIAAGNLNYMFSYEGYVHDVGFARLVLSLVGLLILFVPYRKGERWALVALGILIAAYEIPVFVFGGIPNLGTWPIFRNLSYWAAPRYQSLETAALFAYLTAGLSILGFLMGLPMFWRESRHDGD
jgi:hypothetical protein